MINATKERTYQKQGCTDLLGLILLIIFWSIMIFIASFSFVYGNPSRIIFGSDTFGNVCGRDNSKLNDLSFSGLDLTAKKYLFFMDFTNVHQSLRVCIEKCPDRELNTQQQLQVFSNETGSMLCRYDIPLKNYTTANAFHNYSFKYTPYKSTGPCPLLPVPESTSVLYRCLPLRQSSNSSIIYNLYAYLNSLDQFQKILSDVYLSWKEILGMCVLCSGLVFVMMFLLRYFTSVAVYIIYFSTLASCVAAPILFWMCYIKTKILLDNTPISKRLEEDVKNEQACLVYSIISTIIMIVLLVILITTWKKRNFLIRLLVEVKECFHLVPSLFFLPFLSFAFLVLLFVFWMFVILCMATADFPESKPIHIDYIRLNSIDYMKHSWVYSMWGYSIIALMVTSELIVSCQKMVVAGTFTYWYFERDTNLHYPIVKSIRDMSKYHLGTVVIGSVAIFLFKIPRLIMKLTNNRLKRNGSSVRNSYCFQSCQCCLWCFQKFLQYINHNAYTYTVMNGNCFLKGGKKAFDILNSNAQNIADLNSIGDVALFLAKCCITCITISISVLILQMSQYHFYAVPLFVITVFAFFLSHCFLSLYEMILDTMFLCWCEDREKQLASPALLALIDDYAKRKSLPTQMSTTV